MCFAGPILAGSDEGSNAGGSFRPDTMLLVSAAVDKAGEARDTETQSGLSDLPKGLDDLFGFSTAVWPGEVFGPGICALAGWLLSNHHFCLSELAGGKPGSIEA